VSSKSRIPALGGPREAGIYQFVSRIGKADAEKEGDESGSGPTAEERDAA